MPVRIVEWKLPYTWWTWIEITSDKVINLLLREENNLIMVNDDNEVYTDLQLESWLTPSSDFPVWVTVWKVLQTDWWTQSWLILNWKTTSWDYARWIYANDGKIYFDWWNWTWQRVYYSSEVDTLLTNLRNEVYQYFMKWSDFERDTQTWVNVILSLTTETTPTADFTVSAPTTVRTWQEYVLRVNSVDTAYVMTLWTGIVNPKLVNTNLHAHTSDVFVFLALDDWTLELQPVVEPWATANDWVLTIQKNGTTVATFTANQWTNTTANITVPTVVDNLTTQSSTNALSANQWYELKWMIDDLAGFGKFLSLWNATTWMPISFPLATPYTYSTWDYFVVEVVSSATPPVNYRPNGSSYTWTASSTAETDELEVWDVYVYDGSVWLLQSNHWKTVSFWNIAWDPYDNTNLWNALNAKQDVLTAWANITIDPVTNEISASNTTYSSATSTTAWIVKLWSDTAISETIQSPAWATNKTYPVQLNASGQMWVNVPRANTTYWAWTWISIDANNDIQNTWVTSFNWSTWAVTWVGSVNWNTWAVTVTEANDSTITFTQWWVTKWSFTTNQSSNSTIALDAWKVYTAWTNIDITNDVISAGSKIYNTQWPAPTWYHIPTKDENMALVAAMTTLWIDTSNWNCMKIYMKMPFPGYRNSSSNINNIGSYGDYWSSTASGRNAYNLSISSSSINTQSSWSRSSGFSVRCFKDTSTIPTSSWTTLFDWSSIAAWAWIFHNTTDWLISISSDWQSRITIQDKNLWATTVYNDWDTLTDANCGYFYQWWNNYGFPHSWTVTTSSTLVDASNYWPWNYYNSNTFITTSSYPYDWSSVQNDNLWWWTNPTSIQGFITNDTTWTTTTVTKIWAWTEAEYNALGTYDQSTIYHIY
mgnify:CR=1 FL=1